MAIFSIKREGQSQNSNVYERNVVIGERIYLIQNSVQLLKLLGLKVTFRKAAAAKFGHIKLDKYKTVEELEKLKREIINKRVLMGRKYCDLTINLYSYPILDPITKLDYRLKNRKMKNTEKTIDYFAEQLERVEEKIRKLKGYE